MYIAYKIQKRGVIAKSLEVCMFTIEACFTNPVSAGTLWAMRNNFYHVFFIHWVIFLFDAFHAKSFNACPLHHH